jgi:dTDP-glucose 4,6-dehydratase
MIVVTGGCGFIGSNFIRQWLGRTDEPLVNLDKLTYAGNPGNLREFERDSRYVFVRGDIGDPELVRGLLARHRPRAIVHFAAESHVDRSIHGPEAFIQTNLVGTSRLLEEARGYWDALPTAERGAFRFLNVSTDEVFGSLAPDAAGFSETTPYAPNSPYSASKAGADHLVRAYQHTFGLPTLTTNCSNNYGPYQFPEKLIPLMILNALRGRPLPVYGDGLNVRDWLYVEDHCAAIRQVLDSGRPGETFNIGGESERTNIDVVQQICGILQELRPAAAPAEGYASLITYVADRPGHDRRYAIDARKIRHDLHWRPTESFETGLRKTVAWYLANPVWIDDVATGAYQNWMQTNYASRA